MLAATSSATVAPCGNLPSRCLVVISQADRSADENIVPFIRDHTVCGLRQTGAVDQPPKKRMGIQQQLHALPAFPSPEYFFR